MGKSYDATRKLKDRCDGIKFSSEKRKGINKNIQKDFCKTFKSSSDLVDLDEDELEDMFDDE